LNPLEFFFDALLETCTECETKVLAALTQFTTAIDAKLTAELASLK
jgi:hypothetical protein